MMDANKRWLIAIILIGGVAVLGSYIWGFQSRADAGQILWGGVPEKIRPLYTVNMFLAAAGYFLFTYFILFRLDSTKTQATSRFGYGLFNGLYTAILIPSALWLPLTFLAVDQSSQAILWTARIALGVVGAASLGLFFMLMKVMPARPAWAYRLAVIGSVFFCIQTVILDAIVWSAFIK
ncbi:MAG: hypothetical protein JW726_13120 [Anaerolineales bacterium]|nr:hypothetical protein [Anaerolineales bacterium]